MKFRKKPVEVEAIQLAVLNWKEIEEWSGRRAIANGNWKHENDILGMSIKTLEGVMFAEIGDWIIRGIKGEYYPCKPDIFEATYEAVK